jgi:hypothetical protein
MSAKCCTNACSQGRSCPLRRPISEHHLLILKLKLFGVVLLLIALAILRSFVC